MDYSVFISHTLSSLGFEPVNVFNCFQPPYDPNLGWDLKLPDVEFGPRTVVMLHFQDFITPSDPIKELTKVEEKYKDRSNRVIVVHWTHRLEDYYRGPINLIEFSSHNILTTTSILARKNEWLHKMTQPRDIAWMSLNGRGCNHRSVAVEILKTFGNGIIGYGPNLPLPGDWPYNTYRGTENDENFVRLADLYSRSKINIVTETQYESRPGIITEKTIMAAVAGQIPIVIGHPGIVQDCQELGFDMFDDVVDIGYDWAPNEIRIEQALGRNRDLIANSIDLAPYEGRLLAQRDWVLNKLELEAQQRFRNRALQIARHLLPQ